MSSRSRFRSRHERAATLALVVFAAFLFAGCDSGADPVASPSPTASATSSPSTTTSSSATPTISAAYKPADASGPAQNVPVPVLPDVAKTETKEGLEAFTRYWFELLSYGYETGATTQLAAVTSAGCTMCEQAKQVQTGWHESGRWLVGGKISTPAVSTNFRLVNGQYQVAAQVSQEGISYYNADGSLDTSEPKAPDSGNLVLARFQDGAWFVDSVDPIVG